MNDIQDKIAELQGKGWTLAAMADELGVTVNAVEKWKSGDRYPGMPRALLAVFNELAKSRRVPKQRRYAPGSRRRNESNSGR